MRPENLRQLTRQTPFRPFQITLTDGRTYDVRHPELVVIGRSSLIIGFPAEGDSEPIYEDFVIISLLHVMQARPIDVEASS